MATYHRSVNAINKEFQDDGDRLKEELTKSLGREEFPPLHYFATACFVFFAKDAKNILNPVMQKEFLRLSYLAYELFTKGAFNK